MLFKRFSILLLILLIADKNVLAQKKSDYSANWKNVEDDEKQGLNASALKEVITIFNLAVADENDVQEIKAAMYQMKYRNLVEEDNKEKNIFYIDTLIAKTKAPAKNILQSMQAELLWNYKQQNQYKLIGQSPLEEETSNDITTWSIEKLERKITTLYKISLNNDIALKNTALDGIDAILQKGENTRNLRPTLYDFLAHRALDWLTAEENDVTQAANKFILNDAQIFAPVKIFINSKFSTQDSTSSYYSALLLLQDILKFHIDDIKPDALLDANLIRLQFANEYGIFTNKNELYEEALKNIETVYSDNPWAAQATYLLANNYNQKGIDYDPYLKKGNQYDCKNAVDLCEKAISKYPGSYGALNCKNLLSEITHPTLALETETVNIPNQVFKTLVTYKNLKKVYLRIIRTNNDELKKLQDDYSTAFQQTANLKALKSWSVSLPDPGDYHWHSAEIKIDALPAGAYIILASVDSGFNTADNLICRHILQVSSISYIKNEDHGLYILDRDNGEPLVNAELQVIERTYNNNLRQYEETGKEKYIADKNGYIKIQSHTGNNYDHYFHLKYANDELYTDQFYHRYGNAYEYDGYDYNNSADSISNKTFLFTDRSIYRPGQTIFFKGIIVRINNKPKQNSILANYKTTVTLFDANSQKVGSIDLVSNEFGSYNGSFTLPVSGLNGQFHISDSATETSSYFNVEEYKRPKFFIDVQKPTGTYRVNDTVQVTGSAKAYAGYNIDSAVVKYRVVRRTQYPKWYENGNSRIRFSFNRNKEMEITNGKTVTNSQGKFNIIFKAIPDERVDKKSQSVFFYEITTDITDLNGETRSSNTTIAVAYQAIQLEIIAKDKISIDSLKTINIRTTNINGLFEKATTNLLIQKLQSPKKVFRKRLLDIPDQFVMSKEEFEKNFPYDAYAGEDDETNWLPEITIGNITDTTSESKTFKIPFSKMEAGWYKLTASAKDKYGEEVQVEKYIKIINTGSFRTDEPVTMEIKKEVAEPGEKISYTIATAFEKVWLINTIGSMDGSINITCLDLKNKDPYTNEINVTEKDRGGINMGYAFVKQNRFYDGSQYFAVPWNNKDLNISYETFRDKILPGSKETWKIKITGNKSEKIVSEALVNMYDASLDQFKLNEWESTKTIWPVSLYNSATTWTSNSFIREESDNINNAIINNVDVPEKSYDILDNNGWIGYSYFGPMHTKFPKALNTLKFNPNDGDAIEIPIIDSNGVVVGEPRAISTNMKTDIKNGLQGNYNNNQIRKNFNETAFFFPSLTTDANGNIEFSFTIPEALTTWKMMTLAHTKDLASVYSEKTVITQKPLMIQPNAPRFLREGDRIEFSAKVVNLSDSEITGTAQLELFDAATNKPVDGWFKNMFPVQYFTAVAGQSAAIKFPVEIPFNFNSALTWRIKAISKNESFSDGEESALPVLSNRMLVTETMPLNIRNEKTKNFKFEKLLNSSNSGSLTNHALTVEYTSNPAWYAVQALPYLMEYPYECAEQSFNRYYANTLASYVSNSTPKKKAVFEKWLSPLSGGRGAGGEADTAALLSNLQKNSALKSALLQETPWVLEAQNESDQKKNIAILFDVVRLAKEKDKTLSKLQEMQNSNGGFTWFKGGSDDRYITQYIITGIGHLRKLNALSNDDYSKLKPIIEKALPYLDAKLREEYDALRKGKAILKNDHLSNTAIQYLYMRSFFTDYKVNSNAEAAYQYYYHQSQKYWLSNSKYMQAMIALALQRTNDSQTPPAIIKSLKENAIYKEEMGMYFKEFTTGGYYWYESPIESQAMMIEAFSDIDKNNTTIDDLKTWLLKQKQTQNWKTTKATAEACYALLLNGSNWLTEEKEITINLGNTIIKSTDQKTESGTGYFKQTIPAENVKPEMANINVTVQSAQGKVPPLGGGGGLGGFGGFGSVYWQYFEDLDKITTSETPLKLVKKLFIEKNADSGPVLQALNDGDELHIGDKVKVRIELRADRDMEYIHMKDMRAACMEPVNVISEYKWQGGLGYYESTKDASTNFFFSWLPRGTYVFEYPLFVTHAGNFSNGITTIQCMYAPEFTSHSEGIRINVAEK